MTACFSVARVLIRSAVVSIVHLLLNSRPRIGWHDISLGGKDAPELFLDQIDNRGTLAEAVIRGHSLQHIHVPIGGRECTHFALTHRSHSQVPHIQKLYKTCMVFNYTIYELDVKVGCGEGQGRRRETTQAEPRALVGRGERWAADGGPSPQPFQGSYSIRFSWSGFSQWRRGPRFCMPFVPLVSSWDRADVSCSVAG